MQRQTFALNRARAVQRVKERLISESFPRMQMTLLVALTGGFGLLASYTLLRLGLESMALRYPVALFFAYGFFLFLLWLWLRTNADDYADVPDISGLMPQTSSANTHSDIFSGKGGTADGGGASGDYMNSVASIDEGITNPLSEVGDSVASVADADELAIPLVAIALAAGIALASLYTVYIAPILFAELLVDGALSYALFRHLQGQDPTHWLVNSFRHTVIPFLLTVVFLFASGAVMAIYAPGAASVGQVMAYAGSQRVAR